MIQLNRKFKSRWFMATAEILSADVEANECKVKLKMQGSEQHWFEDWNYQHTKIGFSRGDYFYLKSENGVVVSDACSKHGDLTHVGERNVSGDHSQGLIASEQGSLDNRISDGNECATCVGTGTVYWIDYGTGMRWPKTCKDCSGKGEKAE